MCHFEKFYTIKQKQLGHLCEDFHELFENYKKFNFKDAPNNYAKKVNKNYGRIEIRKCRTMSDLNVYPISKNRTGELIFKA